MPPTDSPSSSRFRLDLNRYQLLDGGVPVRLERQPMELLILLAGHRGRLVTRDEIASRLWNSDVFVDTDRNINSIVRKLRQALNDDSDHPEFLETVVGKGYRFVGPLDVSPERPASRAGARAESTSVDGLSSTARPSRRKWVAAILSAVSSRRQWKLATAAAGAVVVAILIMVRSRNQETARPLAIRSLAVLPLQNLSGDPGQEYFADGMTEALTTALGQVHGLRVISRTSVMAYKGKAVPLAQIARELKVDAVVEGSVERYGDRVRITSQLIYAPADAHLWAGSYQGDMSDVLGLEDDVARAIALKIQLQIATPGTAAYTRPRLVNPRAYEDYLRSSFLIANQRNRQGATESVDLARQATSLDPQFALGYAGLSQAYAALSFLQGGAPADLMPKAREAAEKAVELDPALAAAHTALGAVLLTYDYDWPRAERELRMGVALAPNNAEAHGWYAEYFLARGQVERALVEKRRAQSLDPLSMLEARDLGRGLYYARRYDEAIIQFKRAASISPQYGVIENWIGWCYQQKGDEKDAAAALIAAAAAEGASPAYVAALRQAAAIGGLRGLARTALKLADRSPSYFDPYIRAQIYASLGDADSAFAWIEQAYQQRSVWLVWLKVDPAMDPFRADARYQKLLEQLGLAGSFPPSAHPSGS